MASDAVLASTHAVKRWRQRSRHPERDPETVWHESQRVERTTFDADEVRYHGGADVLLLRSGSAIVTVIHASTLSDYNYRQVQRVREGG